MAKKVKEINRILNLTQQQSREILKILEQAEVIFTIRKKGDEKI